MAASAAFGQTRAAQVVYTYHDALKESVYRVADECYAPVFSVEEWGWTVQLNRDNVALTAEGKQILVPVRTVGGRQTIPLRMALDKLGANLEWDNTTDTLTAKGYVNSIKVSDGKLQISSSLPVKAHVFAMDNPPRLVVDVLGAKLLEDATLAIPSNARFKQFKPDVVRVVVETSDAQKLAQAETPPSADLQVSLDPNAPSVVVRPIGTPDGEDSEEGAPADPAPTGPQAPELVVDADTARSMVMLVRGIGPLSGPVQFRKTDPLTLDVILPGVKMSLPEGFDLKNPAILSAIAVQGDDLTVLRFALTSPMTPEVSMVNGAVRIQLAKEKAYRATGDLAGKIIVVDAGHGGHDTGARMNGVYEKNLTLAIARKTAEALSAQGATVIMTRKTDVFIPLLERSNIANRNAADFFISIHINSNKLANSTSGGITFHHRENETSRELAQCIQDEIAQISKLPNLGAWSDGKIYQSGFSVLRNAGMPAVLLELGFINHSRDRARLQQEDFQDGVAGAIVRGLKVYLGNGKS